MIEHEVKPGDTLTNIAARYGVSVEAIAKANGISDYNRIYAGTDLRIPTPPSSTQQTATSAPNASSTETHADKLKEVASALAKLIKQINPSILTDHIRSALQQAGRLSPFGVTDVCLSCGELPEGDADAPKNQPSPKTAVPASSGTPSTTNYWREKKRREAEGEQPRQSLREAGLPPSDYSSRTGSQCVDFVKAFYFWLPWVQLHSAANWLEWERANDPRVAGLGFDYKPIGSVFDAEAPEAHSLMVGDILIWGSIEGSPYGHVAVVTDIDGPSITIQQRNYSGPEYDTHTFNLSDGSYFARATGVLRN